MAWENEPEKFGTVNTIFDPKAEEVIKSIALGKDSTCAVGKALVGRGKAASQADKGGGAGDAVADEALQRFDLHTIQIRERAGHRMYHLPTFVFSWHKYSAVGKTRRIAQYFHDHGAYEAGSPSHDDVAGLNARQNIGGQRIARACVGPRNESTAVVGK